MAEAVSRLQAVFGLGNPGKEYEGTRHNLGFLVIDKLASDWGAEVTRRRFSARIGTAAAPSGSVLLVKPQTYMNESGRSVQGVVSWHRLALHDVLVVCDDLDLELGRVRIRRGGSSGGHRGLQSALDALGTTEVPRLRIGIGRPRGGDAIDFVLDRFGSGQREAVSEAVERAADAVKCWACEGIEVAMNRFNREKTEAP